MKYLLGPSVLRCQGDPNEGADIQCGRQVKTPKWIEDNLVAE